MALVKGFVERDATREQIEARCRERAQALPLTRSLVLCRVLGEYRLYTLAHDSAITPHLALDGIWEPWVTMAIARYLKPGMRCLDIGAIQNSRFGQVRDGVGGHRAGPGSG